MNIVEIFKEVNGSMNFDEDWKIQVITKSLESYNKFCLWVGWKDTYVIPTDSDLLIERREKLLAYYYKLSKSPSKTQKFRTDRAIMTEWRYRFFIFNLILNCQRCPVSLLENLKGLNIIDDEPFSLFPMTSKGKIFLLGRSRKATVLKEEVVLDDIIHIFLKLCGRNQELLKQDFLINFFQHGYIKSGVKAFNLYSTSWFFSALKKPVDGYNFISFVLEKFLNEEEFYPSNAKQMVTVENYKLALEQISICFTAMQNPKNDPCEVFFLEGAFPDHLKGVTHLKDSLSKMVLDYTADRYRC